MPGFSSPLCHELWTRLGSMFTPAGLILLLHKIKPSLIKDGRNTLLERRIPLDQIMKCSFNPVSCLERPWAPLDLRV